MKTAKKEIKLLLMIAAITLSGLASGQVGINTQAPEATLDVRGKNDTGSHSISVPGAVAAKDGILVPRVSDLAANGSVNGQLVYLVADAGSFTKGFYYWNGSAWTGFSGGSVMASSPFYLTDGSTDAGANKTAAIGRTGAIGIGTVNPDSSALLEIKATDKGILLPRVALTSATDQSTISSPATGLMVYNTGMANMKYVGYVFWNGSEWRTFNNSSTSVGTLESIICSSISLSPGTYTVGIPYTGTLSVPYTGGNGGTYTAQTITSTGVTGLTATLSAGSFAVGSGTLQYSVSGTPSASSPNLATFALNIGGKTCNVSVGAGSKLTVGQAWGIAVIVPGYFMNNYLDNGSGAPKSTAGGATKTRMSSNGNGNTSTNTFTTVTLGEFLASQGKDPNAILPIVNGLRMDFKQNGTGTVSPIFYNVTNATVTVSHASVSTYNSQWAAVFTNINAGAYSYYVDGDDNFAADNSSDEFDITNLTFPLTGEWYQITWHGYRDKSAVDATSKQYFYCQVMRIN